MEFDRTNWSCKYERYIPTIGRSRFNLTRIPPMIGRSVAKRMIFGPRDRRFTNAFNRVSLIRVYNCILAAYLFIFRDYRSRDQIEWSFHVLILEDIIHYISYNIIYYYTYIRTVERDLTAPLVPPWSWSSRDVKHTVISSYIPSEVYRW